MKPLTAALLIALAPIGAVTIAPPVFALPACAEEDGNTDGQPCTWTEPDTGRAFYVDSADYR